MGRNRNLQSGAMSRLHGSDAARPRHSDAKATSEGAAEAHGQVNSATDVRVVLSLKNDSSLEFSSAATRLDTHCPLRTIESYERGDCTKRRHGMKDDWAEPSRSPRITQYGRTSHASHCIKSISKTSSRLPAPNVSARWHAQ